MQLKNFESLPKSIEPCPIIDAIFEIRFSSDIHPDAVFGLIHNALKKNFSKTENLPITQIPETIRSNDPNLIYKPYYRMSNDRLVVQIGPSVLSISSFPKYLGWNKFSQEIFKIIDETKVLGIYGKVLRIGIRYINFFNLDVYSKIDLDIRMNGKPLGHSKTVFRSEIQVESFFSTLQISNDSYHNNSHGSLIDIDVYKNHNLDYFFNDYQDIINLGHREEKKIFFSLLKQEFVESLNPNY